MPEKDYRKVDQENAPHLFSNPNELQELLEDLEKYEDWAYPLNNFNSETGDRIKSVKPEDTADKAKKVKARKIVARPTQYWNSATNEWEQPPGVNKPVANPAPPSLHSERMLGTAPSISPENRSGFDNVPPTTPSANNTEPAGGAKPEKPNMVEHLFNKFMKGPKTAAEGKTPGIVKIDDKDQLDMDGKEWEDLLKNSKDYEEYILSQNLKDEDE